MDFDVLPCSGVPVSIRFDGPRLLVATFREDRLHLPDGLPAAGARFDGLNWDAKLGPGGWRVVETDPGSSICRLRVDGVVSSAGRDLLTCPRFIRGGEGMTAVDLEADSVVRVNGDAILRGEGLHEAVVARAGAGYVLVHRSYVQGSVTPEPGGTLPHRSRWSYESALLATVFRLPLDGDFRPAGPETRPFGDDLAFEMDADGAGVAATTPDGLMLALGERVLKERLPALVSPAVHLDGDTLHVAAIAIDPPRRILRGRWTPPA